MASEDSVQDMERGLIGSILVRPETLDAISESVTILESDFTDEALGAIWRALVGMYEKGKPIDVALLVRGLRKLKLEVKWPPLLADCMAAVPNASHGAYYASHVKQASQRRQLELIGRETAVLATGDDEPESVANEAIGKLEGIASPPRSAIAGVDDWLRSWETLFATRTDGKDGATKTGFDSLDKLLAGGLREGELMVIAGRPGCGKTALATGIATAISRTVPVLFVSLEMSQLELADRMLSAESGVGLFRMKTGTVTQHDREQILEAFAKLSGSRLSIVDGEYQLGRIVALARQWRRREGEPGVLVIDYLQLLEVEHRKGMARHEAVGEISRKLKQLAKTLGGPVIALSQLNRQADGERPRLSHLRESGSIEQDANQVLMLWEVNADSPKADGSVKLIKAALEKNRNGATGELNIVFRKECVAMQEAAPDRYSEFDEFNSQDSSEFY